MDRVFLTGYRGTGKTTVAHHLAALLTERGAGAWTAIDADDRVEREAGATIADLFARRGESYFRDLEERVVASLCGASHAVVALGGGAVLREATRGRIAAAGPVVWLTARPVTLAARLAGDASTAARRPSLTGLPPEEEIERVLANRTPVYAACATFAVDTEGSPPHRVAELVAERLGFGGGQT